MEVNGVEAQDEHFFPSLNRWKNWEGELSYPTIHKELCGGGSIRLGGPFGVSQFLLQQLETFSNWVHPLSNVDGQITNYARDLGSTWTTPKWCKWGSANGHTTLWRKATLVGGGKSQLGKGAQVIQEFCGQVRREVKFQEGDEVWLNIKNFRLLKGLSHKFLSHMRQANSKCWKKNFSTLTN